MTQEQKVQSIAETYEKMLLFFKDNPDVLEKWKNRMAGVDETPDRTQDTDTTPVLANKEVLI